MPKCTKTLSPAVKEKLEIEKAVLEKFQKKSVKVCIIGAQTKLGEMTAFMLKQNPLVTRLFLTGEHKRVNSIAADLNHMDTRSIASGHPDDIPGAIRVRFIIKIRKILIFTKSLVIFDPKNNINILYFREQI